MLGSSGLLLDESKRTRLLWQGLLMPSFVDDVIGLRELLFCARALCARKAVFRSFIGYGLRYVIPARPPTLKAGRLLCSGLSKALRTGPSFLVQ